MVLAPAGTDKCGDVRHPRWTQLPNLGKRLKMEQIEGGRADMVLMMAELSAFAGLTANQNDDVG